MPKPHPTRDAIDAFIARWSDAQGAETANNQMFATELCRLLGVEGPAPQDSNSEYAFEYPVTVSLPGDQSTTNFLDLYKAGHFVWEAKQGSNDSGKGIGKRLKPRWQAEMRDAHGQALGYAKSVARPPPFLIVCDVGFCFDLYAQFDGDLQWRPYPAPTKERLFVRDLHQHVDTLRAVFEDPHSLDPARHVARITREVAAKLALLATELEKVHPSSEQVATFLMRCVFTMFAEDVKLLPTDLFKNQLETRWVKHPEHFAAEVRALWNVMDTGGQFGFLGDLLRFNGNLFKNPTALPLNEKQLEMLLDCARCDWSQVEPSIFGTLLERALSPAERHKLGAHYTPRAYVERLVRPTIEEPLRAEWDAVQIVAHQALQSEKPAALQKARKAVVAFHTKLCNTRVLDPACGTGNFLYVAFDLFKRLEGEVIALEKLLTQSGETLGIEGLQVSPKQFLGIEVKPWAKQIAELVLWIGYLQWHFRLKGSAKPDEPVLRAYENIECRDAVLDWDDIVAATDDEGKPLTRWDGVTTKTHPVTGKQVPDETARVEVWKYVNPRPAKWPEAEFIIGNPPFIGNKRMRDALGDGYTEALRKAHKHVPGSVDFVMYWWDLAARKLLAKGSKLVRFGFITTNSITQTFNRRVLAAHMEAKNPLHVTFAIPDHPWVDSEDGAAVRIAMTVAAPSVEQGALFTVCSEVERDDGSIDVSLDPANGIIDVALRVGTSTASAKPLESNRPLCLQGCKLVQPRKGPGFTLTADERLELLRQRPSARRFLPRYVVGDDLTNSALRERYVIDFFGHDIDAARQAFPEGLQLVMDRVKPFRDGNARKVRREKWWLFGENAPKLRRASQGLSRFIATSEVAKHRVFSFCPLPETLADGSLAAIAHDDAFVLGVLSSKLHVSWALHAGGTLEDRPRYQNGPCFDPFPFPDPTDAQKETIRALGEELDAHRKRQQAKHPTLTITGMYNVLEKLRADEPLTAREKVIHEQGLVSLLKELHDRLDVAVFDAYGWPADLSDEQIIERLVALNAERAAEEKRGLVRWLRPEFQNPDGVTDSQTEIETDDEEAAPVPIAAAKWPKTLPERMPLVRDAVMASGIVSARQLAKAFSAKRPAEIVEVLDGLAMLGYVTAEGAGPERRWIAAGR